MNICLVCREAGPESCSGLGRSMGDLAAVLADDGHAVHLLIGAAGSGLDLRGVAIHPILVPLAPARFMGAWPGSAPDNLMYAAAVYRQVASLHREHAFDAVLASLWCSEAAVCLLDDRFPTVISCITSLRTLAEIDWRFQVLRDLDERLTLERETMRRARYLHGLTEAVLRKTIGDFDLQPLETAVIGRGLRDRSVQCVQAASELCGEHSANVLFVGRHEARKGVDTLLASARLLVDDGVPVSFTIAGPESDQSFREAFDRDAAERPPLRSAVRFVGAVSDASPAPGSVQTLD